MNEQEKKAFLKRLNQERAKVTQEEADRYAKAHFTWTEEEFMQVRTSRRASDAYYKLIGKKPLKRK